MLFTCFLHSPANRSTSSSSSLVRSVYRYRCISEIDSDRFTASQFVSLCVDLSISYIHTVSPVFWYRSETNLMRIRKRKVPLPLSSLSPVPLSDLRLEPLVQLRRPSPPPLDHPNQRLSLIRRPSVHSGSTDAQPPPDCNLELLDLDNKEEEAKIISVKQQEGGGDEKNQKINISRNPSISLAAHTSSPIPPHSLPSSNQVERWCDGDKAFPLKKRRGSFERRGSDETRMMEKMKTKMNNKCEQVVVDDHDYDGKREESFKGGAKSKRGGRAGAVVMEGSRCSRVNGRGWRCCQQTLVGYSLCEHHLGKGRLRSMTSVRSRSGSVSSAADATAPKKMKKINDNHEPSADHSSKTMLLENQSKLKSCSGTEPAGFVLLDEEDQEVEDGKKPLMVSKKRMKLGMVKARSMSSLLGQGQPIDINISYAVADVDDDDHIYSHA